MTTGLMLDAAFPPSPDQWVADMRAVGAVGGFVYVYGPYLNFTPAHVTTARAQGMIAAPIVVPGNNPPNPTNMIASCRIYDFNFGPVWFDFESGSEPTDAWWRSAKLTFEQVGFRPDRYGTSSVLGLYSPGDDPDWFARWIESGTLAVIPALPAGQSAWQFVNDVTIAGSQYDVSVVNLDVFNVGGSESEVWESSDPLVQEHRAFIRDVTNALFNGVRAGTGFDGSGTPTTSPEPSWPYWLKGQLDAVPKSAADPAALAQALVAQPGFVDAVAASVANAVGPALAANQPFMDAVALAVAHHFGSSLDKAT